MAGNAVLPISFFKIILKTNLERIKIPSKFTERYGGGLLSPVLLKPRDGTKWEVYWKKQNGEVWFEKGWKEFAKNYSLDHGYLLVFEYEGTSEFDVLILDKSALEIDYPFCDNNLDQSDDDKSVEILDEWPDQKPKKKSLLRSPPPYKKYRGESEKGANSTSLSLNCPRDARARAISEEFIASNPFFTVSITPASHAENQLHVPDLEGYIENKEKEVKLQIGKNSWNVKLIPHPPAGRRNFSAGWSMFVRESELRPGDVCVFELISREDPVAFEVHVYKHHS